MLPLPEFKHHRPTTIDEVVDLLNQLGARAKLIAGGTDLLPNMKHGLFDPEHLISLGAVAGLAGISEKEGAIEIGAMTTLDALSTNEVVKRHCPALATAAGAVAGPQHRRMGTLGGNICLDTRCVYYNQTYFWRNALGFCLKKDGSVCHVVKSGKNCVAAASNDTAPALMVLDADVVLVGPAGKRVVNANDFYRTDGINNTTINDDEMVTRVCISKRTDSSSGFEKLRRRAAIDFPLLNMAIRVDWDGADGSLVSALDMVVSTLAARPKRIKSAAKIAVGTRLDDTTIEALGEAAYKRCRPLTNLDNDTEWRRDMVPVLVKRLLRNLRR